jgi:methyltransferase (TIGR00027 family)
MNPQAPSRTALATALMRALHTRSDPRPILDDPWGDRLLPAQALSLVYQMIRGRAPDLPEHPDAETRRRVIDTALRRIVAYPNVLVRSRFTEDALHRAVAGGIRQYVLVGAGFDSYALRRPPEALDVTVIEIDHPATQSFKRDCLAATGTAVPPGVHHVAADLAGEDLADVLRASPLRASEPAFFAWLGVTMYLTREENLATLRAVADVAAPGSEVVFTYIEQAFFDGRDEDATRRAAELRAMVASVGEPFVSGFDPEALATDLGPLGYALIGNPSDLELLRRYDPEGVNGLVVAHDVNRIAHLRVVAGDRA